MAERAMSGRRDLMAALRRWLPAVAVGGALLVALLLVLPTMTATHAYFTDWANHLWLIAKQADIMRQQGGLPGLFMDTPQTGLLYPQFLFYGGTVYAAVGYVAVITGSAQLAYAASWIGGTAAAYGGLYWAARMVGLSRPWAQVPAITYVSSAYFLTNIYARGAWTEFIATSFLILAAACAMRHFKAAPVPLLARFGLTLSVALVVGSHLLTVVWGTTMAMLILAITVPWWRAAAVARPSGAIGVVGAIVVGAMITAWQYLPAIPWFGSTTIVSQGQQIIDQHLASPIEDIGVLISPWRWVPDGLGTPHFFAQVPILVMIWIGSTALLCRRRPWGPSAGLAVLLIVLMSIATSSPIWDALPGPWKAAQFPYRVLTYVVMITCILLTVGLRSLTVRSGSQHLWAQRASLAAIVVITAISGAMGLVQSWTAPTFGAVQAITNNVMRVPETFYAGRDYRVAGNVAAVGQRIAASALTPSSAAFPVGPYRVIRRPSNVVWSPGLTGVSGAVVAGASSTGIAVVSARPAPGTQPVLRAGTAWSYRIGGMVSLLALVLVGLTAGWGLLRWSRPRAHRK